MNRVLLITALVFANFDTAWAAGVESSGTATLIWQALNLLLLLAVLVLVARKPLTRYLAQRRAQIGEELATSGSLLEQAQARVSEWQRKLAELDRELEEIRTTARERAEAEGRRVLEEARTSAERIRSEARGAVTRELERARQQLRRETADLTIELAERWLSGQVTEQDRERLVADFIQGIENSAAPARPPAGGRT